MDHPKFMIEAKEAEIMTKKLGLKSVLHLLPLIVKSAQKLARVPISGFSVGAVGLTSDGQIFIGVNVEFPGLPLHHSIHAEQFLITNLSNHPKTTLQNVVVSAYPCGHCRQFLQEIRGASDIQILVLDSNEHDYEKLDQINGFLEDLFKPLSFFLPNRFGPDDLLDKDLPLILETHENGLGLSDYETGSQGQNGNLSNMKSVILAALEAANKSHAHYSGCPSGIAIVDEEGRIFKGSYMESAAYNPSLGPAQAAVITYIAATADLGAEAGYGYAKIVGAVLVEMDGAPVRQEDTVRLFFKVVAPKCELLVCTCKKCDTLVSGN